jgi:hypothetical protein
MTRPTRRGDVAAADDKNTTNERAAGKAPVNPSTNQVSDKGIGCIVSVRSQDVGGANNLPVTYIVQSLGDIRRKPIWPFTCATDLGALMCGFFMGLELPDGGPRRTSTTDQPAAGDMNPYKAVNGKANMRYFGYNTAEGEGAPFDINKLRGIALRTPILVKGWGFDIYNRPLTTEENKLDQDNWPTGALDLRYDCARKVWTIGHGHREMLPHMHLTSGPDISGGGIAFGVFYPDDPDSSTGFQNLNLP